MAFAVLIGNNRLFLEPCGRASRPGNV